MLGGALCDVRAPGRTRTAQGAPGRCPVAPADPRPAEKYRLCPIPRDPSIALYIEACQDRRISKPLLILATEVCYSPLAREPLSEDQAAELSRAFKALADPVRLRLLSMIASHAGGEACVCDLTGPFDLSQPTISHHLKVLRQVGLVEGERPRLVGVLPGAPRGAGPAVRSAGSRGGAGGHRMTSTETMTAPEGVVAKSTLDRSFRCGSRPRWSPGCWPGAGSPAWTPR